MLPLSGNIISSQCAGRASPKAVCVILGMWLPAFHSERFKSQSKEDMLSFSIRPLSPTWLLLLNFIFLKSISKFFTHSREAKLDSRRSPQQTSKPSQKVTG